MIRRPCPRCLTTNAPDSHNCARCGASLYRQTIIIDQDTDEPYRVETARRVEMTDLSHVGRAMALTAATFTAEAALGFMERRFMGGRPLGSAHARRLRNGALSALTGAAILLAEQTFVARGDAGRPR